MTERAAEYRINESNFRVMYGDITRLSVDAVVSSDDTFLSMGGGVSLAIATKAGDTLRHEARKHIPMEVGDVVATSAGDLAARYVFHAATLDYERMIMPDEAIVARATGRCMKLAEALEVRSIAFPALGTGVGGFPFQLAADVMMNAIASHLSGPTSIQLVIVALWARPGVRISDLNLFYERSVGLASVLAQSRALGELVADLRLAVERLERPELLSTITRLEAQLDGARQDVLAAGGRLRDLPIDKPQTPGLHSPTDAGAYLAMAHVSERAVAVSEEFPGWSDRQLGLELSRTKVAGLSQKLNVATANLNRFEIERAKYGGISVPPRLENAIDDLRAEIDQDNADFEKARDELARLGTQ